jgi:hypothetical protein
VRVACQRPQPMLVCKGLIIMWQGHEDIVLCSKAWHLVWEALCLIFRPWICHRANVILHVQPTFFSSFFQSISFVGKEVHSKLRIESYCDVCWRIPNSIAPWQKTGKNEMTHTGKIAGSAYCEASFDDG